MGNIEGGFSAKDGTLIHLTQPPIFARYTGQQLYTFQIDGVSCSAFCMWKLLTSPRTSANLQTTDCLIYSELKHEHFFMNFRFTKAEHLTKKKEFEKVFHEGKVIKNAYVVLYVIRNDLPHSRLGLVVSKKTGNAVRRNRAKRLLREVYRLNKHLLTTHVDMIVIPRHPFSSDLKFSDIEYGFKKLLLQINETFPHAVNEVHHQ